MRILYTACHEILEYDELRLLCRQGHEVFSLGDYHAPGSPGYLRRPEPGFFQPTLFQAFQDTGCSLSLMRLTPEFLRNFDVAILMHYTDWFVRNRDAFGDLPVVIRTIGQSNEPVEQGYAALGNRIKIVRYTPRETSIEGVAKTDAIIRFAKFAEDFGDWEGGGPGMTFHNQYRGRDEVTLPMLSEWERFHRETGSELYGTGNEDVATASGVVPPEQFNEKLRKAAWYFYVCTYPVSYTLSFIEAMFAGVPIIAPSRKRASAEYFRRREQIARRVNCELLWLPQRYEIGELLGEGGLTYDTFRIAADIAASLRNNRPLARATSSALRARAEMLFDARTIGPQWTRFLKSIA